MRWWFRSGPEAAAEQQSRDAAVDAEEAEFYRRQNEDNARFKAERIAQWSDKAGRRERALQHAKWLDDIICIGGMTHERQLDAIRYAIERAVIESQRGDTEGFYQ